MKIKSKDFLQEFKMPRLYREDLETIENIINELKPKEYKLEIGDYKSDKYKYNNVKSIPKELGFTYSLEITTHDPTIHISFSKNDASISTPNDNLTARGAVSKIIEIVHKCESGVLFFIMKKLVVVPIILLISPIIISFFDFKLSAGFKWLIMSAIILSLIWWVPIFYYNSKFSKVNFIYFKESDSFIKRNQDNIILGILGIVLTTILTVLFS